MERHEQGPGDQAEDVHPEESKETPPLTTDEIQALRALLRDASIVLTSCPLAIRALSKR